MILDEGIFDFDSLLHFLTPNQILHQLMTRHKAGFRVSVHIREQLHSILDASLSNKVSHPLSHFRTNPSSPTPTNSPSA